jgi:nucleotidyltransferase/DNA polymerase involved in DNA repair
MGDEQATAERVVLHVDMDAFFAAVEQHDNPELRGKPVIVGAARDARGVVCTCSYEARAYGVHSAMPSRTAARLCPHGVFVRPRGSRYAEVSRQVFEVFQHYTPEVEALSIDEAFLDVSGSTHLFGSGPATAAALKAEILSATGLTASVGVATNKFLAKLASDLEKPDGITVVPSAPAAAASFLAPLPISRIWGVGPKSAARMHERGIHRIADIQALDRQQLARWFGKSFGARLEALANGRDNRPVSAGAPEKSVSNEHTFGSDCSDWAVVEAQALQLAEKVGYRLRKRGLLANTVFIKLRWDTFDTISRQRALPVPDNCDRQLIGQALSLLNAERRARPVRLVGVGAAVAPASAEPRQPELLLDAEAVADPRDAALDSAVDQVREQFGRGSLRRGFVAQPPDTEQEDNNGH